MATVTLGNTAPIATYKVDEAYDEVERVPQDIGNTETFFDVPESYDLITALSIVTKTFDQHHSDDPPAWVESNVDALSVLIAEHYKTEDHQVQVGRPEYWGNSVEEVPQD